MTTKRTNRALATTRRWTAGVLLATTLAAGGLGVHLADAYASQSGTVAIRLCPARARAWAPPR